MSLSMDPAKVRYEGKPLFYHSDGTGRDSYIVRNNGGLLSQNMLRNFDNAVSGSLKPSLIPMKLGRSPVPQGGRCSMPAIEDKFVHYHSDGTGRDSYVGWNHGGRIVNFSSKNNTENFFKNTLRTYSKLTSSASLSQLGTPSVFTYTSPSAYLSPR